MSELSHLKNKLLAEQVEDEIYHYIPVSYTHLDVYKRQAMSCGSRARWWRLPPRSWNC